LVIARGDVVVCALPGDYGKPRPAVVVQSDLFNETHASIILCPISSEVTGLMLFRIELPSSDTLGLKTRSEVMVDKLAAVKRQRVKARIGRLSAAQMRKIDEALRTWLDLGATSE
jgi:mRNA interferase MazF